MKKNLSLKKKEFLKKSYSIRKLLNIFKVSKFIIIFHVDTLSKIFIKDLRLFLLSKGVKNYLINKDNISMISLYNLSKGPTIIFYSNQDFYPLYLFFIEKNKIRDTSILYKNGSFLSFYYTNIYIKSYGANLLTINNSFIYLFNFYKNFIYLIYNVLNIYIWFFLKFFKFMNYLFINILLKIKDDNV